MTDVRSFSRSRSLLAWAISGLAIAGAVLAPLYLASRHADKVIGQTFKTHWTSFARQLSAEASMALQDSSYINNEFASYLYRLPAVFDNIVSIKLVDKWNKVIFSVGDNNPTSATAADTVSALPRETTVATVQHPANTSPRAATAVISSPIHRNGEVVGAVILAVAETPSHRALARTILKIGLAMVAIVLVLSSAVLYPVYRRKVKSIRENAALSSLGDLIESDEESASLRELLQEALVNLAEGFDLRRGRVFLRSQASGDMELVASLQDGENAGQRGPIAFEPGDPRLMAIMNKKPLGFRISDSGRVLSRRGNEKIEKAENVAIPIIDNHKVLGLLEVGAGGKLGHRRLELILLAADKLASIILRMLKAKETLRRMSDLEFLLAGAGIVVSQRDLGDVLTDFSGHIVRLREALFCRIYLLEENHQVLTLAAEAFAGEGRAEKPRGVSFPLEDMPIYKLAMLSGQAQLLRQEDLKEDSGSKGGLADHGVENATILVLPLYVGEQQLGCMAVGMGDEQESPARIRSLLDTMASQLAVFVANSRQLQRLTSDIRQLQTAQRRNIQVERLQAMRYIAAGISSDIEDLISAIKKGAEALANLPMDARLKKNWNLLSQAARDAQAMVSNLKSFSEVDKRGKSSPVELARLVNQAVEQAKQDPQLTSSTSRKIVLRVANKGSGQIFGNQHDLQQAIFNIVRNCVEAMPQGGTITIESKIENNTAILSISDQGTGMTEEVRSRIFEPFFTTKNGVGQGLGMSAVYGIVTANDGTITVESKPGQGSKFILQFPLVDPEQTALYGARKTTSLKIPLFDT